MNFRRLRRFAAASTGALALTVVVPLPTAHADSLVSDVLAKRPECISLAPYEVHLSDLVPDLPHGTVEGLLARISDTGDAVRPEALRAFSYPSAHGRGWALDGPGAQYQLCPSELSGGEYEVTAVVIATPPVDVVAPVSTRIDPDSPSTYHPDQEQNEPSAGKWRVAAKGCFAGGVRDHSHRDVCWQHSAQVQDADPNKVFHQMYADARGWRLEDGEFMYRMYVDVRPRPGTAYQYMDGLPTPKADYSGGMDCVTDAASETLQIGVSSGSPVIAGWARQWTVSKQDCDRYLVKNPSGERARWACVWEFTREGDARGTTGVRNVAVNNPVWTAQNETRAVVFDLVAGQYIDVD